MHRTIGHGGTRCIRGSPAAYTTVMTVMGRHVDRHMLVRLRRGRRFVYRATEAEDAFIDRLGGEAVDDLIGRFGSAAYLQFAIRLAEVDDGALARLERLARETDA